MKTTTFSAIDKNSLKNITGGRPTLKQYIEMGCKLTPNGWDCPL